MAGTIFLHVWLGFAGKSLVKPLCSIFNLSLLSGIFPSQWKKGNVVPVQKRGDRSIAKNYRPVSLLPVFSKLFEKCIYYVLYNYFATNNLFLHASQVFGRVILVSQSCCP